MIFKIIDRITLRKFSELCVIAALIIFALVHINQLARQIFVKGHGKRMGVVTKLTERGWFNKSWEGELFVPSEEINYSSGALDPDIWNFSVTDTNLVSTIESCIGKNIILTYNRSFDPKHRETLFDVIEIATNNVQQVFIQIQDPMVPFPRFVTVTNH